MLAYSYLATEICTLTDFYYLFSYFIYINIIKQKNDEKKNLLSILALLLTMVTQGAWAWDGSGTAQDPYQVECRRLGAFALLINDRILTQTIAISTTY